VRAGAGKQVEVETVGSCGTLAGQRRRAKQELSCGEVFDDVHGVTTPKVKNRTFRFVAKTYRL